MKLSALILDDEKTACQVLNSMLDEYCPEIDVKLVTQDPFLALSEIQIIKPHVLFIDINMPKMSGFEFIERISEFSGKIIFVTAYDQYAIRAFKYAAFDYLLKPIHVEQLEETVARLVKEFKPLENKNSIKELLQYVSQEKSPTISVHHNAELKFIKKDQICYFEADGNYTKIHAENEQFTASKTLKEYETMLDESIFLRVHKSYIVNMQKVAKYSNKESSCLILHNGKKVPISRRKRYLLNQFSI